MRFPLRDRYEKVFAGSREKQSSPTGHLVWIQRSEGQLLAARFDLEDQRITGSAVPIAEGVGGYSFSSNGTLVYNATGLFRREHEYEQSLAWLDIQGKETTIQKTIVLFGSIQQNRILHLSLPDQIRLNKGHDSRLMASGSLIVHMN